MRKKNELNLTRHFCKDIFTVRLATFSHALVQKESEKMMRKCKVAAHLSSVSHDAMGYLLNLLLSAAASSSDFNMHILLACVCTLEFFFTL